MIKALSLASAVLLNAAVAEGKYPLPQDLTHEGQPIPDYCVQALSYGDRFGPQDMEVIDCFSSRQSELFVPGEFRWDYLGEIRDGVHVIFTYLWPADAMGKFTHIIFVQREGNRFSVLYDLHGYDRHSTMIEVEGLDTKNGVLKYSQNIAYENFRELPGCSEAPQNSCYGEACYMGYSLWSLDWKEGSKHQKHFHGFAPAEGPSGLEEAKEPYDVLAVILTEEYEKSGRKPLDEKELKLVVSRVNGILQKEGGETEDIIPLAGVPRILAPT